MWGDQNKIDKVRTICIVWFYDQSRKIYERSSHKIGTITFHKGMLGKPPRSPLYEVCETNDKPVQP